MFIKACRCFKFNDSYHAVGDSVLINLNHALAVKEFPGDPDRCLISFSGYDREDDDIKYQFISDQYVSVTSHCCIL